jgi:hypothetical protein
MKKLFGDNLGFPHYLYLLPLFFVLHGYVENIEAMRLKEGFFLLGQYLLVTMLIVGNTFLIFRLLSKAAFFTFSVLFFHLFFGAFQDTLKKAFPGAFINQYSFILPVSLAAFILLFIFLYRTKKSLKKITAYLNLLLLVLVLIELPGMIQSSAPQKATTPLTNSVVCDTCKKKPDVYFIIADEYGDSASLQEVFGFNNTAFQTGLRNRGFHIINNSKSNYNFTTYSMASMFQMNYLQGMEGRNSSLADKNKCYDLINNSSLWTFFKSHGYELINHSIFNIANIPTEAPQNYILIGADMIVSQTFLSRVSKDLRYHLATTLKIESEIARVAYFINRCNQLLLSRSLEEPKKEGGKPKFVYTHLTMPHYPYYFTKEGKPNPVETLVEGNQVRQKEYIEYLQYCNGLFLESIDRILKNSKTLPIIIFMSDHGFREFTKDFEQNAKYYFMNLNAVYLPNGNPRQFYEGISAVNQFRVLLNTSFGQHLPLLKDSTIFLQD